MTSFVIGVWVVTLIWLGAGFLVFQLAIARALREKGVAPPSGFRGPAFMTEYSGELQIYRLRRVRAGQGLGWWRFMIAWRWVFLLLTLASLSTTIAATFLAF